MATINYKGMELEEITEPQIFDPPKTMVVDDGQNSPRTAIVTAILAQSSGHSFRVLTDNNVICYRRCALLPEKLAPRRATNRELSKWLAQGKGEWGISKCGVIEKAEIGWFYDTGYEKQTLQSELRVRKWGDTEWHNPTVDYMGIEDKEEGTDV